MNDTALAQRTGLEEGEVPTAKVIEVRTGGPVGCFEGEESRFQVFSYRLVLMKVGEEPVRELDTRMSRAAHEAAMLAWDTPHPLVTFPCLFEERLSAGREAGTGVAQDVQT